MPYAGPFFKRRRSTMERNLSKPSNGRRKHSVRQTTATNIARERLNGTLMRAAMLDRLADAELQHGHHLAAEHLSRRAAEMRREAGR